MGRFILTIWVLSFLLPQPVQAVDFGVEFSMGLGMPIGSFIDRFPVPLDDVSVPEDNELVPGAIRVTLENDPSFFLRTTGILEGFLLHFDVSRQTWGSMVADAVSFQNEESPILENVFFPYELLNINTERVNDLDGVLGPLWTYRALLGYRFYLRDVGVRPYVTAASGFVLMLADGMDPLAGGAVEAGVGCDFDLFQGLAIGIDISYSANIMENPGLEVSGLQGQVVQSVGTSSLFETVFEVQQVFLIQMHVQWMEWDDDHRSLSGEPVHAVP